MKPHLKTLFCFSLLLFSFSSCTDDQTALQQLLASNKSMIAQKVEQLEALSRQDKLILQQGAKQAFNAPLPSLKLFKKTILPSANTVVIHENSFKDLSKAVSLMPSPITKKEKVRKKLLDSYRISQKKNVINTAISLFRNKRFPISSKAPEISDYREAFQALKQLKYVIVVHHLQWEEPQLLDDEGFTKGLYKGYVTVFDLAKSDCFGGFHIDAQSSSEIKSYNINNQSLSYYHLMKDYIINIQQAFKTELKNH